MAFSKPAHNSIICKQIGFIAVCCLLHTPLMINWIGTSMATPCHASPAPPDIDYGITGILTGIRSQVFHHA